MTGKYSDTGRAKPYLIFGMTDETFAILSSTAPPEGVSRRGFYLCVTLLDHVYWITGSILGVILGTELPFDIHGIEFVMTALFTAIVVEQLRAGGNLVPFVIGVAASAVCLVLFGPDRFLLPAMAAIVAALTFARRPLERGVAENNMQEGRLPK